MPFRFRNFKVYKDFVEAYKFVIGITNKFPKEIDYLQKQIRRAALSVILNIAEGSAKNSDKDFNRYIKNSLGSSNEVVAGMEVALISDIISEPDFYKLIKIYENITNQLGGLSKKLNVS